MFLVICNPLLFSRANLLQVLIPFAVRGAYSPWLAGGSPLLLAGSVAMLKSAAPKAIGAAGFCRRSVVYFFHLPSVGQASKPIITMTLTICRRALTFCCTGQRPEGMPARLGVVKEK